MSRHGTKRIVNASARPKRVLGYARVSSRIQALGTSLVDQQNAIRAYAEARGLKVDRFYVEAESAVRDRAEHRVQMLALLDDVRPGDLVLCDKMDRWSRDAEFSYSSIRQILEKGAAFYAVGDRMDPATPEGDTAMGLRILVAREEHKRIKERMVGTRAALRAQGYFADGLVPYGYKRSAPKGTRGIEKNILVVDPPAAELVRRMFRMCIDGMSLAQISARLKYREHTAIAKIIRNRHYLGEVRLHGGDWIPGKHVAIVDAATFAKAAEALSGRKNGSEFRQQPARTDTWVLRDVARCASCGGRMSAAYGHTRDYYVCARRCTKTGHHVRVDVVEAAAEPLVLARLGELRHRIARGPDPRPTPGADVADEIAKLEARRMRVLHVYEDGAISREQMRERIAAIDLQRAKLDAENASSTRRPALADTATRRTLLAQLTTLERAWVKAKPQLRRRMLNVLAVEVRIRRDEPPAPVWRSEEELATREGGLKPMTQVHA